MNVVVVGGGGREHAICYAISKSDKLIALYAMPGNPGIAEIAECIADCSHDHDQFVTCMQELRIDLVVVGPETPLAAGLIDVLDDAGIPSVGPSAEAAQLEASKIFCKGVLDGCNVPTAAYKIADHFEEAVAIVEDWPTDKMVVKADGLAAGKGVSVCQNRSAAKQALSEIFVEGRFGSAGEKVVIEDTLQGREVSFFALSDGRTVLPLKPARDYKCLHDQQQGPNTGGMGTFCPTDDISDALQDKIMKTVIEPTVQGMAREGIPFKGILFAGLMIDDDDAIHVIEYNVRFGDPEAQTILLQLESDFLMLLHALANGNLHEIDALEWRQGSSVCVVMSAENYPEKPRKGDVIAGLEKAKSLAGVTIFHAGTTMRDGKLVTNGGRVMNVCAQGSSLEDARKKAYAAVACIQWEGAHWRHDIAAFS